MKTIITRSVDGGKAIKLHDLTTIINEILRNVHELALGDNIKTLISKSVTLVDCVLDEYNVRGPEYKEFGGSDDDFEITPEWIYKKLYKFTNNLNSPVG